MTDGERYPVWLTEQERDLLLALLTGQPPKGGSHIGTALALARWPATAPPADE